MITRKRTVGAAVLAAAVIAAPLALQSSASFTAAITNDSNTAGSGSIVMLETNPDWEDFCVSTDGMNNTFTCTTLNLYGREENLNMPPNDVEGMNLEFKNTGSVPVTGFTLTAGGCTTSNNGDVNGTGDLCTKMLIKITNEFVTVIDSTPASEFTSYDLSTLIASADTIDPDEMIRIRVEIRLDPDAGNAFMGRKISQSLTWTFTA